MPLDIPLDIRALKGVPICYFINKQVVLINNNLTSEKDDGNLRLYSSFRISNLIFEEGDFDANEFGDKLYNFILPSNVNKYFKIKVEKDLNRENSVTASITADNEWLFYITKYGLKDWLPLDVMTINELGSSIKITQNKLLSGNHNSVDELDEVIDVNNLYYKLKALSLLIANESLSTSDLQAGFQQALGGLDMEIGITDIINEGCEQASFVSKRVMYLVDLVDDNNINSLIDNLGLTRSKEKILTIVIDQLKQLLSGKICDFMNSFTFLTAVTLYNFYHTFKSIYDIWNQFKTCDELSKYLSEKKGYLKIHLDQVDYCIKKMLKSLNADDAKYEDYLKNFKDLNEKMEDFIIEVKVTAIHCRKVIEELCEKKKKYEAVIGVGTFLAAMGLSGVSLAVLAALSRNLGNKIENFNKTLDLFKDLNMKLETKKKRRHVKEQEFVENKQFLITEYELLMNEFGAFESEL
ncbi:6086_t:CDS:2 [Entrophospora sp. SA101]|nr:12884_t:CDS:2 [Entrophospora sp. SA101]CAJ0833101.1 6086_t:CDS:2 [Entrophospora sp. SA101]